MLEIATYLLKGTACFLTAFGIRFRVMRFPCALVLLFCLVQSASAQQAPKIVRAQSGDTISTISVRFGVDPLEVARLNGLLPNSVLGAGREVKIPSRAMARTPVPLSIPVPDNCYSDREIDLKAEKLSQKYFGNDLSNIIKVLRARENIEKDEFETTIQFRERIKREREMPIVGGLFARSTFSVILDGRFRYDADGEEMRVEYDFSDPVPVNAGECGLSTYITPVIRESIFFVTERVSKPLVWSTKFPVKLADARQIKPNLRSVALFKLVTEGDRYFGRMRDNRFWRSSDKTNLIGELVEVWIFDELSGTIFGKHKINLKEELAKPAAPQVSETDTLLAQARAFLKSGNDDDAMATLRRVLASEPMSADSYLLLGKIHLRRGDIDQAISSFKTSIFWDNRMVDAHVSLGKIYVEKRDCLQAKTYVASASEIDAGNQDVLALQRLSERCSK